MARLDVDIFIDFDRVICHDEADGWGDAEPYLWTAFFRIGGDDVTIVFDGLDFGTTPPTPIVHLEGSALLQFGPGSHGNLGTSDVDAGDVVPIPAALGQFETLLKPIPIPEELKELGELVGIEVPDDLPGFVGALAILMEEDNVTDDGAEAGHAALNNAIREAIQTVIDTRTIENPGLSDDEIEELTRGIEDKISDAIQEQQNLFEDLWSFLNPDDQIGNEIFLFNSDELIGKSSIPLQVRFKKDGDWEIVGELIPTAICPADAVAKTLEAAAGVSPQFTYDRDALRHFRDHEVIRHRQAIQWWKLVRQNKAQLVSLLLRDTGIRNLTLELFNSLQTLAQSPDDPIPDPDIDRAEKLLEALRVSKNRRTRVEASRALALIGQCRGKTLREALTLMNTLPPARFIRQRP